MSTLIKQLQEVLDEEKRLDEKKKKILKRINIAKSNKTIECNCCKKMHKIRNLTFVQKYWLFQDDDYYRSTYWTEGEIRFICPQTGIHNRLLFVDLDIPYEKRQDPKYSPQKIFSQKYAHLFKEMVKYKPEYRQSFGTYVEDDAKSPKWVNCYYVDQNRSKFDLPEKRKTER